MTPIHYQYRHKIKNLSLVDQNLFSLICHFECVNRYPSSYIGKYLEYRCDEFKLIKSRLDNLCKGIFLITNAKNTDELIKDTNNQNVDLLKGAHIMCISLIEQLHKKLLNYLLERLQEHKDSIRIAFPTKNLFNNYQKLIYNITYERYELFGVEYNQSELKGPRFLGIITDILYDNKNIKIKDKLNEVKGLNHLARFEYFESILTGLVFFVIPKKTDAVIQVGYRKDNGINTCEYFSNSNIIEKLTKLRNKYTHESDFKIERDKLSKLIDRIYLQCKLNIKTPDTSMEYTTSGYLFNIFEKLMHDSGSGFPLLDHFFTLDDKADKPAKLRNFLLENFYGVEVKED